MKEYDIQNLLQNCYNDITKADNNENLFKKLEQNLYSFANTLNEPEKAIFTDNMNQNYQILKSNIALADVIKESRNIFERFCDVVNKFLFDKLPYHQQLFSEAVTDFKTNMKADHDKIVDEEPKDKNRKISETEINETEKHLEKLFSKIDTILSKPLKKYSGLNQEDTNHLATIITKEIERFAANLPEKQGIDLQKNMTYLQVNISLAISHKNKRSIKEHIRDLVSEACGKTPEYQQDTGLAEWKNFKSGQVTDWRSKINAEQKNSQLGLGSDQGGNGR